MAFPPRFSDDETRTFPALQLKPCNILALVPELVVVYSIYRSPATDSAVQRIRGHEQTRQLQAQVSTKMGKPRVSRRRVVAARHS